MARRDVLLRLHKSLLARGAALRNALAGEVENLRRIRTDQTGDSADGAFDSGSEEISTKVAGLEARELNQIHRALTRLTQGTYGICEVCQEKIPVARLNALPFSTTCINCKREIEGYPGSGCAGLRDGGDWEKIDNAEPALEDRRDVDLTTMKRELSSNR
jgi:DnaK suppressor protein